MVVGDDVTVASVDHAAAAAIRQEGTRFHVHRRRNDSLGDGGGSHCAPKGRRRPGRRRSGEGRSRWHSGWGRLLEDPNKSEDRKGHSGPEKDTTKDAKDHGPRIGLPGVARRRAVCVGDRLVVGLVQAEMVSGAARAVIRHRLRIL